jgi:hypothetical protein
LSASTPGESPWYTQTWFVVLLLWFIYPIGLILMWTQTTWNTAIKWLVTLVPVLFIVIAIVLSFSLVVDDDADFAEGPTFVEPIETIQ